MPAADRLSSNRRVLEAERTESGERLGIVGDAGENEIARGGAERGRVLEQTRIVALDGGQAADKVFLERLEAAESAKSGEAGKFSVLEGQALRLLVRDHLQPVLDAAKEKVGLAQLLLGLGGHPFVGAELTQHVERARAAHLRPPTAEDELLRLDEELDLPDAAAAELQVVTRHDHLLVAAHRVDLTLHGV